MSLQDVGLAYNLVSHLKTLDVMKDYTYYVNGFPENAVDECVRINSSGGVPGHQFPRIEDTIQILARSRSKLDALNMSQTIYGEFFNRFGLDLPAYTGSGGSPVFPALHTAQISPIQTPGYLGTDSKSRHMYSFNLIITWKRE